MGVGVSDERRAVPRIDEYDPGRLLTHAALFFVGILIVFVASIIGAQIWQSGEANTESWAALTGLIGWATSQVSIIFSNRFGTTQQSAKKDEVIAQQSRAATVLATVAAGTPSVTPAPMNPETGVIPAAEATTTTEESKP